MIEAGIHTIAAAKYHADPAGKPSLTASIADVLVNQTPLHAWNAHPRLNPNFHREEKTAFDLGSIVHALILEGDSSRVEVIDAADWRKKDAQEQRDSARARGLIPILEKDWERVEEMTAAIRAQLGRRQDEIPLFSDGKPEQTLVWEERGVTCRSRLDWLRDDHLSIDDLKTTARTANPVDWNQNTLWNIGADIQVAFYLRGLKKVTGIRDAMFRYVIAEASPPYAISVLSPAPSMLELGKAKVERAIDMWRECVAKDEWPGYPDSVYHAEPPPYVEMRWLEKDGERIAA